MKKLLIANWKMNPETPEKAESIFSTIKKSPGSPKVEVVIIPPAIYIPLFKERGISIGAQNIYFEKKGAFTGEISPMMVKNSGCKYVLVGHSERRNIFGEEGEEVNKKMKVAIKNELVPILCVGENKVEKNNGETGKVIREQIKEALQGVNEGKDMIIAYEPIWAIGTGNSCKPETAFKMRLLIKKTICQLFDRSYADKTPVIYGGSANLGNCKKYTEEANFSGLLVGGASLKPSQFAKMIREI